MNCIHHPRKLPPYRVRLWMGLIFFFLAEGLALTAEEFLYSVVGLMVTQPDDHVFDLVIDEILQDTSEDGIVTVGGHSTDLLLLTHF